MEIQSQSEKTLPFWRALSYILVLLLLGMGVLWFVSARQVKLAEKEIKQLKQKNLENTQFSIALQLENEHRKEVLQLLTEPHLLRIPITHSSKDKQVVINLAWDTTSKNALIWTKGKLTQVPNSQFQLWVETGEKTLSVGLFYADEFEQITEPFPINVESWKRFFITHEKLGGSETPTFDNLIASSSNN